MIIYQSHSIAKNYSLEYALYQEEKYNLIKKKVKSIHEMTLSELSHEVTLKDKSLSELSHEVTLKDQSISELSHENQLQREKNAELTLEIESYRKQVEALQRELLLLKEND